jgi:hypothetical protein
MAGQSAAFCTSVNTPGSVSAGGDGVDVVSQELVASGPGQDVSTSMPE